MLTKIRQVMKSSSGIVTPRIPRVVRASSTVEGASSNSAAGASSMVPAARREIEASSVLPEEDVAAPEMNVATSSSGSTELAAADRRGGDRSIGGDRASNRRSIGGDRASTTPTDAAGCSGGGCTGGRRTLASSTIQKRKRKARRGSAKKKKNSNGGKKRGKRRNPGMVRPFLRRLLGGVAGVEVTALWRIPEVRLGGFPDGRQVSRSID